MLRRMRPQSGPAASSLLFALALPFAVAGAGCIAAAHGPVKAQETALDLNVHARFGRMELATELVAPKSRVEFIEHRKGWGGKVRIADTEMAGLRMVDEDNADIAVKVAWYDMSQQELRVTTLRQKWHSFKGDWKLVSEARTDGDAGLIGDGVAPLPGREAPAKSKNARFPTVHLGAAPETAAQAAAVRTDPAPEPAATAAAEPSPDDRKP